MAEVKQYTREELEEKLTPKERIFCEEYVVDWNGARSARAAGYSEDTAKEIACQNLAKLHIKQYLEFIKNDIERLSGVTKMRNIKELAKLAYSGIEKIHDTWITLKEFEDLKSENPDVLAAIESIDTKTETRNYDDETIETKYVKIKLHSKIAAITEINKMMGYNAAEKKELTGAGGKDLVSPIQVIYNGKEIDLKT